MLLLDASGSGVAVDYGVAWRANAGGLSSFAISQGATEDEIVVDFSDLAAGKTYTLQTSNDLDTWSDYHTFTAAASTDNYIDPNGLTSASNFFRLVWDPVN